MRRRSILKYFIVLGIVTLAISYSLLWNTSSGSGAQKRTTDDKDINKDITAFLDGIRSRYDQGAMERAQASSNISLSTYHVSEHEIEAKPINSKTLVEQHREALMGAEPDVLQQQPHQHPHPQGQADDREQHEQQHVQEQKEQQHQQVADVATHTKLSPGVKRRRVRVIRKTIVKGKVVKNEVVGISTVLIDKDGKTISEKKHENNDVWYSEIIKGNFKAYTVNLQNRTREGPFLTEKLWMFEDPNSERLFLYNKLLQHEWHRNVSNLYNLREELLEGGINSAEDLVVTHKNAPVNSSLFMYIATKVVINGVKTSVPYYNVTPKFLKHTPHVSPFLGKMYKKCAVIGNSGSLINSSCGRDIDSFDMIFRCNAAPISEYVRDAGWKTNVTTFNPSIFHKRFNALGSEEDYLRFRENIKQYHGLVWMPCFGSAGLYNVCITAVMADEFRTPDEPRLVVGHPDHFIKFWNFWKDRNITSRPSSGFFIAHAAIQLCEETHLYGFWPFPLRLDSTFERVPYHYFDDLLVSKSHSMNEEFSVFLQYHELGIIRIHTGKCQG